MENLFFKPETNLTEISQIQSRYTTEENMLATCSVEIEEDGELDVVVDKKKYKATDDFYQSFFKLLRIPYPFTKKIPTDLVRTNVERLKDEFNMPIKLVKRDDDTLVNIVNNQTKKGKPLFFKDVDTSMLLDNFGSNDFELKNSYIGDDGAVIDIVHKDLGKFEATDVGDIVEIGYRIRNPFTMFDNKLSMSLYLNQLKCTNGMVLGTEFGSAVVSLNKDIGDEQVFIQRFRDNINSNVNRKFSLEELIELYKNMVETPIKYRWLKPIMNTVNKISDGDLFHKVFKFDLNEEKDVYTDRFLNEENEDSDWKYFDTIYSITEHAQKESIRDRLYLEEYNKSIVNLYKRQDLITKQLN